MNATPLLRLPTVGIVSTGESGNVYNLKKVFSSLNCPIKLIETAEDLKGIHGLVLPGVGAFSHAIHSLESRRLTACLKEAISVLPTLGICLGMHLLASFGEEGKPTQGFDQIPGQIKKMNCLVLPHLGFASIHLQKSSSLLFNHVSKEDTFYFMHSYEFVSDHHISSYADYNGYPFVASIEKDNIFGVQFHPEKSRESGIKLIKNFIRIMG